MQQLYIRNLVKNEDEPEVLRAKNNSSSLGAAILATISSKKLARSFNDWRLSMLIVPIFN